MDDNERERILYRIDERTEQIQKDINRIESRQRAHEDDIAELQSKTQENTNNIKAGRALLGALGTAVLAVYAKVVGLVNF